MTCSGDPSAVDPALKWAQGVGPALIIIGLLVRVCGGAGVVLGRYQDISGVEKHGSTYVGNPLHRQRLP